jgi:hypothetical protein
MRKSKIKIGNVEESFFTSLASDPAKAIEKLDSLSITLPEWARLILLATRPERQMIEASFFEDARDFFLVYTKKVLRNSSGQAPDFICFSQEEDGSWKHFVPPTLIGTNLRTKLRKQ